MYYIVKKYIGYEKMPKIDPVLNNNDWATIQRVAQSGNASNFWGVGDRKEITLNGTVGYKTFSNTTVYAYILGFNHNASKEGNNTIHFQFGFDALANGKHIAFCDSRYGDSGSSVAFRMNTSQSATGGWEQSYMRNTIVPAFINAIPSDLQAVLKTVNKYTDNGTGSMHTSSENVTATQDKVFLLSEYEIIGQSGSSNYYEQLSQAQYPYYADSSKRIMYKDTSTSTAIRWLGRSPASGANVTFVGIDESGTRTNYYANYSYGFAPAFVVG